MLPNPNPNLTKTEAAAYHMGYRFAQKLDLPTPDDGHEGANPQAEPVVDAFLNGVLDAMKDRTS
jgi:hypothetical protein